jgi:hypothetical protein
MVYKPLIFLISLFILIPFFTGCIEEDNSGNVKPVVEITHPIDNVKVFYLVMISGTASDYNGDETIQRIEVKIDNDEWKTAEGTTKWKYDWDTYEINDGSYDIQVRGYDGALYSEITTITVNVDNPKAIDSPAHKWAVFIGVANFPSDNESKLGNGGLFLAEKMAEHFIIEYNYPTSNIFILFDDGWIRTDNGYGKRSMTLQERPHDYEITYGGATTQTVKDTLSQVIEQANAFDDSEVFIWLFSHGCGDESDTLTGGKILEESAVFLWDDIIRDKELGDLLYDLRSDKTCVLVDACFSGGFADRTIFDFPTFFLMKSNIPSPGRVVITGTSKFRLGYASTMYGPLFTLLWFEGLTSGKADGFRSGILETGRSTSLQYFKDGKVSVEEAFYFARQQLRTDPELEEYNTMQPQINDQYPNRGIIRSSKGLILG